MGLRPPVLQKTQRLRNQVAAMKRRRRRVAATTPGRGGSSNRLCPSVPSLTPPRTSAPPVLDLVPRKVRVRLHLHSERE